MIVYDQHLYDRLLARVRKDEQTGCWLWTGPYYKKKKWPQNRYGFITLPKRYFGRKRPTGTHRAMMMAIHGSFPSEQVVCHRCDVPLCINPEHLFLGTMGDNIRDSRNKNRHHEGKKDFCDRGHPLFGDNVRVEQQKSPKTGIRRICRTCVLGRVRMRNGWPEDLAFDSTIKIPKGYKMNFVTRELIAVGRHRSAFSATEKQT